MPEPIASLTDFPAETCQQKSLGIYDDLCEENRSAVLSHILHNPDMFDIQNNVADIQSYILEYMNSHPKDDKGHVRNYDIDPPSRDSLLQEPQCASLFPEFFNVPFPNPLKAKRTFIDLFAGIGGIRLPFSEMGYKCVFSSEWDKNAQKTYFVNFGEIPFGDICLSSVKNFIPEKFDLLLAGFPCQAFSIMGKQKGFEDTRGTLFFEVADILRKHRPKAFLLENVKQLTTHDKGRTFSTILNVIKELGYHCKWKVLNALDFGLPQKRERVIIVGFSQPDLIDEFDFDFDKTEYSLSSILEKDSDVDPSLFASDAILKKRAERTVGKKIFYPSVWHENKSGNISILDHACALRTGASYNYLLINGIRRPSSRELLRFQGFPDKYAIAVSHSEIRRQTGNSVPVPMIRQIARKIDKILDRHNL